MNAETADARLPDFPSLSNDEVQNSLNRIDPAKRQDEINSMIASGIGANRWTCPDLVQQLKSIGTSKLKTVLCCAIDLDPALPIQDALLAEHAVHIAAGVAGLGHLLGANNRVISLAEDSRSDVVLAMKSAAALTGLRLDPLLVEYPLAYPRLVARQSLGIRIPADALPPRAGMVFLDAPAALAIGRYFLFGAHVMHLPGGVYDRRLNRSHLAWIPVGMSLDDVLSELGITIGSTDLFTGHMLLERRAKRCDVFSAGSEYAVFASDHHAPVNPDPCVRCGWCAEACPVDIHPAGLLEAAQQQDMALADRFGVRACIECGICSHVCPSRLPLLESIRGMRTQSIR